MNKTSELKSCSVFLQDKVIGEVYSDGYNITIM